MFGTCCLLPKMFLIEWCFQNDQKKLFFSQLFTFSIILSFLFISPKIFLGREAQQIDITQNAAADFFFLTEIIDLESPD